MTTKNTLLESDAQKTLCALLGHGNTVKTACAIIELPERTFHEWMRRGEQEDVGKHRRFFDAVSRARGMAKAALMRRIAAAAEHDWRAAAWALERLFPKEYAPPLPRDAEQEHNDNHIGVKFVMNLSKPLAELLDFPVSGDEHVPNPAHLFDPALRSSDSSGAGESNVTSEQG